MCYHNQGAAGFSWRNVFPVHFFHTLPPLYLSSLLTLLCIMYSKQQSKPAAMPGTLKLNTLLSLPWALLVPFLIYALFCFSLPINAMSHAFVLPPQFAPYFIFLLIFPLNNHL